MVKGRRPVEDRISDLPDELLHSILVRLHSAHAAARTSVLSRRWRHVWADQPDLVFDEDSDARRPPGSLVDTVDAALAAYSAPTLGRLRIVLPATDGALPVRAHRAAQWLDFAWQHVVGELHLDVATWLIAPLYRSAPRNSREVALIELPTLAGAKTVVLALQHSWLVRLQSTGVFAALTSLKISCCCMDADDLTALVCTRCPLLRDLSLCVTLYGISDICVLSNSLQSLSLSVKTRRLEIVAPRLEELSVVHYAIDEARISAPKLAEVVWRGDTYDPHRHKFTDVGRRLRLLRVGYKSLLASLMRQFDEVDELYMDISIPLGVAAYKSFLKETKQLPKCRTLRILLTWDHNHSLLPGVLHLLRSCNNTSLRKVSVEIYSKVCLMTDSSCTLSCPCLLPESRRIDDINLISLEEVEIINLASSNEELKFMEQLSKCNEAALKKIAIKYSRHAPPLTKETCEKVRSMCHPNVAIEFYLIQDGSRVCFD